MACTCQHADAKKPQGETALSSKRPDQVSSLAPQHPLDQMRTLQQALGNQGVLRRMEAGLRVNDVNDPAEREADRVAESVMSAPHSKSAFTASISTAGTSGAVQRKCASCAEEDEAIQVQRKEASATAPSATAPPLVNEVLNSPGQPLDRNTRSLMEERFNHDFSDVKVHTDAVAAESANSVNALAYTVGPNVVFSPGHYAPDSAHGQKLLAHELVHVVQQRRGGAPPPTFETGSTVEQDAKQAAAQLEGSGPIIVNCSSAPGIARQEAGDLPWWKKRLNPLYQGALKVLPKEAVEKLEQANAVAKQFIKDTGVTDEGLNQAVQVAEPVLRPIADYLGVKSDLPPAPKADDKKPTVWAGKPPIDVRLQQRREQKAAQAELDKTDPGAIAPPVRSQVAPDSLPSVVLSPPDVLPGEVVLPDGQKVVIPPKPPFEVTEDIRFGQTTLAPANVQGVRAEVVRNLNYELRLIEGNAEMSRSAAARFLNDWPIMRRLADLAGGAEPPSQSIWIDVDKNIEKAHKAIVDGDLPSAVELTKAARKSLRNAQATWGRYTDKNIGGAEGIKTVAEGTRDAAKYTLIVLAVAASGGTALVVATAGGIAIDLADVVARAALGEQVNWAEVTVDIAIQVITAKFGGQLSGKLLKALAKNPGAQGIESRILTQVIEGLITGAESRTLATSIRGLYSAASSQHKMMTWDEFIDQIADPTSGLIDIITGTARGIQARQQASPAGKVKPIPDKQRTTGRKQSQAKPPTNDYDVEAWEKYYKENPDAKRSVGAAQRGDPLFSDYTVIYDDEEVNIPPEIPKTRVEDRPRGSAIEDRHLAGPDYSRPKEHNFPGIDAWKGGGEREIETATGKKRIIFGADVLQVKSIDRSSAKAIQRRVQEGIDGLDPNEFELRKGTTRVINPRSRRLDVIFEEGVVLDLNAENKALLRRLSAEAGRRGIEIRWFKFVGDREVPIPIP